MLLPAWKEKCQELKLGERVIPRDVRTRWNSTYDMLDIAVKYREAVDAMCADRKSKLRRYELQEREWKLASQLVDVLKV